MATDLKKYTQTANGRGGAQQGTISVRKDADKKTAGMISAQLQLQDFSWVGQSKTSNVPKSNIQEKQTIANEQRKRPRKESNQTGTAKIQVTSSKSQTTTTEQAKEVIVTVDSGLCEVGLGYQMQMNLARALQISGNEKGKEKVNDIIEQFKDELESDSDTGGPLLSDIEYAEASSRYEADIEHNEQLIEAAGDDNWSTLSPIIRVRETVLSREDIQAQESRDDKRQILNSMQPEISEPGETIDSFISLYKGHYTTYRPDFAKENPLLELAYDDMIRDEIPMDTRDMFKLKHSALEKSADDEEYIIEKHQVPLWAIIKGRRILTSLISTKIKSREMIEQHEKFFGTTGDQVKRNNGISDKEATEKVNSNKNAKGKVMQQVGAAPIANRKALKERVAESGLTRAEYLAKQKREENERIALAIRRYKENIDMIGVAIVEAKTTVEVDELIARLYSEVIIAKLPKARLAALSKYADKVISNIRRESLDKEKQNEVEKVNNSTEEISTTKENTEWTGNYIQETNLKEAEDITKVLEHLNSSWEYALAPLEDKGAFTSRFNLRVIDLFVYAWAISSLDRNKIAHMINGNTELGYLQGDLFAFRGAIPVLPIGFRSDEMCTNISQNGFKFNKMELTTLSVGTGVLTLTNFAAHFVLVMSIDGSTPPVGQPPITYNSGNFQTIYWGGFEQANLTTAINVFSINRPLYLPPGASLWIQTVCPASGSVGGLVDYTLHLIDGNFDPTNRIIQLHPLAGKNTIQGWIAPENRSTIESDNNDTNDKRKILYTLYIRTHDKTCKKILLKCIKVEDYEQLIKEMGIADMDKTKYYIKTTGGKTVTQETDLNTINLSTLSVSLKLFGGSQFKETENPFNTIATPLFGQVEEGKPQMNLATVREEREENKKEKTRDEKGFKKLKEMAKETIKDASLLSVAENIVRIATTKICDYEVSTQQQNRETLIGGQAGVLQTIPVQDNNVGSNIGAALFRESFFAQTFVAGNTALGIATSHRTVSPSLTYNAKWISSVLLSKAFATLDAALQTGDLVVGSQSMRLRGSMANGDAIQRALYALGAQLRTGLLGSYALNLVKVYAMIIGEYPLPGLESSGWIANLHPAVVPDSRSVGVNWWPETVNTAVAPIIQARIIDVDVFTGILSGTYSNPLPAGYTMDTWGKDTALVAIRSDQTNTPATAAIYTLSHMEFPYLRRTYDVDFLDDSGNITTAFVSPQIVSPVVDHSMLPGPKTRVLFVVCNIFFGTTGTDVAFQIGTPAVFSTLTLAANGLLGTEVNIEPSLTAVYELTDQFPIVSWVAVDWWKRAYGSRSDATAALVVLADISRTCSFSGWCIDNILDQMFYTSSATAAPWNSNGYTETTTLTTPDTVQLVDMISRSTTTPWGFSDGTSAADAFQRPTRFMMQPDQTIGVLVTWGALSYDNKAGYGDDIPSGIPNLISRVRHLSKYMTVFADMMLINTGLPAYQLFDPSKTSATPLAGRAVLNSVLNTNGFQEITNAWQKIVKAFNIVIEMMGDLPIMYRAYPLFNNQINWFDQTFPLTLDVFPINQINPSRSPFWYIASVAEKLAEYMPTSYVVAKLELSSRVIFRQNLPPPQQRVELFEKRVAKGIDSNYIRWIQVLANSWVTGQTPLSPRFSQRMRLAQDGLNNDNPVAIRLNHPSESLSHYYFFAAYGPPITAITAVKDLPTLLVPPLRNAIISSYLRFVILSDSAWWRKITVNPLSVFTLRIANPKQITTLTQEIADTDQAPEEQMDNLGF